MNSRSIVKQLIVGGLVLSIVGWAGIVYNFCLKNCSETQNTLLLTFGVVLYSGLALLAVGVFLAVYRHTTHQKGISKIRFWEGLLVLCLIGAIIWTVQTRRNAAYEERLAACDKSLNIDAGDDPLKCNYIK